MESPGHLDIDVSHRVGAQVRHGVERRVVVPLWAKWRTFPRYLHKIFS
jgi:hypothetical protein